MDRNKIKQAIAVFENHIQENRTDSGYVDRVAEALETLNDLHHKARFIESARSWAWATHPQDRVGPETYVCVHIEECGDLDYAFWMGQKGMDYLCTTTKAAWASSDREHNPMNIVLRSDVTYGGHVRWVAIDKNTNKYAHFQADRITWQLGPCANAYLPKSAWEFILDAMGWFVDEVDHADNSLPAE